jgi:hypothetical protein
LPVLLLKKARSYRRPRVAGRGRPDPLPAKPARLDAAILQAVRPAQLHLHGRLHVMFANNPPLNALALGEPTSTAPRRDDLHEHPSSKDAKLSGDSWTR